jgi:TonB family protein
MAHFAVRAGLFALVAAVLAAPAFADLKTYNAAVLRADFASAANEAKATWPTLDKSRADIFVIAREFGWTAMVADRLDVARDIMSSPPGSTVSDDAPELTAVLKAWVDFRTKSDGGTRKKLMDALTARAASNYADLISVRAAQDLFRDEWDRNAMPAAARIAELGAKLVSELGEDMIDAHYAMQRFQLVSEFIDKPQRADFVAIAELADQIKARLAGETNPAKRERLIKELANTLSWKGVERNVLGRRNVNLPDEPMEGDSGMGWFTAPGDLSLSQCAIALDMQAVRPRYPRMALSKGLPGYAIYAFEVGEGGAFRSARVLGSAPHESFTETIDEILPTWRWKMRPGAEGCRMPQQHVVHFVFSIR